jgi:hypothetical protein
MTMCVLMTFSDAGERDRNTQRKLMETSPSY